jgi:excisionase family DNA binding protein
MERLLTVKDLSELLQLSPKTIRNWAHIGYVPYYKFRKDIRFNKEEIIRWERKKHKKGRLSYKITL